MVLLEVLHNILQEVHKVLLHDLEEYLQELAKLKMDVLQKQDQVQDLPFHPYLHEAAKNQRLEKVHQLIIHHGLFKPLNNGVLTHDVLPHDVLHTSYYDDFD